MRTAGDDGMAVSGPTRLDRVTAPSFDAAGDTEVAGDVRASRVRVAGATSIGGDVSADRVETAGQTHVGGDVAADSLDAAGQTHVGGDLRADRADLSGATRVEGATSVDTLSTEGAARFGALAADSVEADGAIAADEVRADGVTVTGAVEADEIHAERVALTLGDAESAVGEVTAESVAVERAGGGDRSDAHDGRLTVERVRAATVDLAHTTAGTVEGGEVTIGPGCEVEMVRAPDSEIHETASVGRIERPE